MIEEFESAFLEIQKKYSDNETLLIKVIEWLLEQCKKRTEKQFTLHHKGIRQYLESNGIKFPHNKIVKRKVEKLTKNESMHQMAKIMQRVVICYTIYILTIHVQHHTEAIHTITHVSIVINVTQEQKKTAQCSSDGKSITFTVWQAVVDGRVVFMEHVPMNHSWWKIPSLELYGKSSLLPKHSTCIQKDSSNPKFPRERP